LNWGARSISVPAYSSWRCCVLWAVPYPSASFVSQVELQGKTLREQGNVFIEVVVIVRKLDITANPEKKPQKTLEML